MTQTNFQNTFICVILGDKPTKKYGHSKCTKDANYSFFSNAVVITLLAQKHGIPADHIIIFVYGRQDDSDISVIPTQRVFFQLNIDEIYKSNDSTSLELNLKCYTQLFQIESYFRAHILPTNPHPDLLIFLDNHDNTESFGSFQFFDFYLLFLSFDAQSLNIFIDCYQNNSFIHLCKLFNCLKNQFEHNMKDIESHGDAIQVIQLIIDALPMMSKYRITEPIRIIFSHILHFFQEMALLPNHQQSKIRLTLRFLHEQILDIYPNLSISSNHERASILKLPFNEEFFQTNGLDNCQDTDFLFKYFPTIGDIFDLTYLISTRPTTYYTFQQIALIISLLIQVQEELEVDTLSFLNSLQSLFLNCSFIGPNFNNLFIPSSYFLCTTSHLNEPVLNQSAKFIGGSPGMSAFIQEVFLFPHPNGISLSRLQEMAPEKYAVFISNQQKLHFESFGTGTSLEFKQFTDTNGRPLTSQEIMSLINFDLAEKDHETPTTPDFPCLPEDQVEDADHRTCLYQDNFELQMAPNSKPSKRERYQFPTTKENMLDTEEYYSDDTHVKQVHSISQADTLLPFDWNQEIPQQELDSLSINVPLTPSNPYVCLRDVFFDVFQQVKDDNIAIEANDFSVSNSSLYCAIYDWLKCFLPADYIVPYVSPFAYPIISYITKSTAPLSQIQKWFFSSLNIADQYVMYKLYQKKTFIKDRLNNPKPLPPITNNYLISIFEKARSPHLSSNPKK